MTGRTKAPRGSPLITRGAKLFGKVVSASTANLHRFGYLPGDDEVECIVDVPYTRRAGKQCLDVYLPKRANRRALRPFVFFVHGGGFVIGDRKMGALMGRSLAARGIPVVAAGYRLAPAASLDDQRRDLSDALGATLRSATRFAIDPRRYALLGESAGAHLATRLLQAMPDVTRPRAAIGMYGAYDLRIYRDLGSPVLDAFLGTVGQGADLDAFVRTHQAVRELPFTDVPVLLLHGDADRFVPVDNSRALARVLERQGVSVELAVYPGAGHGFNYQKLLAPHHTADSFHRIERFFVRHVRGERASVAVGDPVASASPESR